MRNPFFPALVLLLLSLSFTSLHSQEVTRILTADGEIYHGEIVVETPDTVTIRSTSGADISIPRTSIQTITYRYDPHRALEDPYWALGITLGTPAGLNLVLGYNFNNDWGARFSGGYIGTAAGLQIDGLYRLGGESARHYLNFGVGTLNLDVSGGGEWTYLTGGYNLQVGGFDLMLGLSAGSGDFPNPQFLFQIGYVHRFRD